MYQQAYLIGLVIKYVGKQFWRQSVILGQQLCRLVLFASLTRLCTKLFFQTISVENWLPHNFAVHQLPSTLNLGGYHSTCKCGIYLIGEFRLLLSRMALVFTAFKSIPDLFPNVSIILTIISNEILSHSNIFSVSSAYCGILFSVSPVENL